MDEIVCSINNLQDEFDENDSEIETVARDCIGEIERCFNTRNDFKNFL